MGRVDYLPFVLVDCDVYVGGRKVFFGFGGICCYWDTLKYQAL